MKIICFSGNLGNQIFYCAFKEYLRRKKTSEKIFYFKMHNCPNIKVDKLFNLELPENSIFINILSALIFYGDIFLYKLFKRHLPKNILCSRGQINERAVFYSNYLQDKYYYEKEDSSWLKIKTPTVYPDNFSYFSDLIKTTDSVCVHIRRGDYISPTSSYEDLSNTDFYEKAIEYSKNIYPDANFFFFSDDLDFVREKFSGQNYFYVDCNRGSNSYLDILLMSQAKVNIIANSTFSYWGAYMGHEKKIVLYSDLWFRKETGRDMPNIMLEKWICIESNRF